MDTNLIRKVVAGLADAGQLRVRLSAGHSCRQFLESLAKAPFKPVINTMPIEIDFDHDIVGQRMKRTSANFEENCLVDGSIDAGLFVLGKITRPGQCRTQEEIAFVCGCHPGRIGQIERAALKKIRNKLKFGNLRDLGNDIRISRGIL